MDIKTGIQKLVDGHDLSQDESAEIMREIMSGAVTPAQFGAFITALRIKEETPEEICGMASIMREFSLDVNIPFPVVDTCGTGGDGKGWFNISTAAALVVAGAGIAVAKHGNRAMSGSSGSADVLEAMGVKIDLSPNGVQQCIEKCNIGFMFAQTFHPAMKFAGPLRPQIGIRTVFNLLGPLTNPARSNHQVLGTSSQKDAEKLAKALSLLGTKYSLVVHSESGADEIDVEGVTVVYQVTPNGLQRRRTRPADFGLPECSRNDLTVNNIDGSVQRIQAVLSGSGGNHNEPESSERSAYNSVIINAAAAIVAVGKTDNFQHAASIANDSIKSGAAAETLEKFVKLSNTLT